MDYPIFKQENYPQELGSGEGYSIAKYGCALCAVCSVVNWYGRNITPDQLNLELVSIGGFDSNGTKNEDGTENKTLLFWSKINQLYGEIRLEHNVAFPTTPADLNMVDAYLEHNQPVVVGVSFLHVSTDKLPSHYVVIYKKNIDGTYQCMDPWYGDSAVFDTRYAVNGMSVGNAILQIIAYSGPVPTQQVVQPAPDASHPQQAVTPNDILQKQAQDNWNLYLQEVDANKRLSDRIKELEGTNQQLTDANQKLIIEIGETKGLNSTLATHLSTVEKSDSTAVAEGLKAQEQLKEQQHIVNTVTETLRAKPTLKSILVELDTLFSKVNWAKRVTQATQAAPAAAQANIQQVSTEIQKNTSSILQLFGFSTVKEVKSS